MEFNMKQIIFLWLLIFIYELTANPAPQTFNFPQQLYGPQNLPIYPSYPNAKLNYPHQKTQPQQQTQRRKKETFFESVPNYPENIIKELDLSPFKALFSEDYVETLDLRFNADEKGLCNSRTRTVFPKRAETVNGNWLTIINIDNDNYRQGVRVEECFGSDRCDYSSNFPNGVQPFCKQMYTYRVLVALNDKNEVVMENFKIPSCCKCVVTVGLMNRLGNIDSLDEEKPILPY